RISAARPAGGPGSGVAGSDAEAATVGGWGRQSGPADPGRKPGENPVPQAPGSRPGSVSADAPTSLVHLSATSHAPRGARDEDGRGPRWDVRGRRHGPLPEHEAATSGAADRHLADGDSSAREMRDAGCGMRNWTMCDTHHRIWP